MRKNWHKIAFWIILAGAFVLRIVALSQFPKGFTADEAAQGYTAYSILKTGRDEWGEFLPLNPRSFGDFKPPLYTYFTIPSIAVFGLNEFAVRLPAVLFGILAVFFTYLLVRELFKNQTLALISALLLAISPWHLCLSRGAFEANLTTFFLTAGFYFFLRGLKQSKLLLLSVLFFGLNLFSYHSARLITPLFLGFLVWWKKKYNIMAFLIFGLLLGIAGASFFTGGGVRISDIGIFSAGWEIPKLFIHNYLSYLSPEFFFAKGAGEATYGMIPGRGVLYLFELPALVFAFIWLAKKWDRRFLPILVWLFFAPIPAALSLGVGYHANRVAVMMPAIQILSAYGVVISWNYLKKFFSKKFLLLLYSSAFLLFFTFFLKEYIFQAPKISAPAMSYGWRQTIDYISKIEDKYQKVIISRQFSEPQTFVAFYKKWNPQDFQKQSNNWLRYQKEGLKFVDQLGNYSLGKYEFRGVDWNKDKNLEKVILVVKEKEISLDEQVIKRIIPYPDGKPAFLIIEKQ